MKDEELIEAHATKIALAVQAATSLSEVATRELKWMLIEFAEEIKRQAIEP